VKLSQTLLSSGKVFAAAAAGSCADVFKLALQIRQDSPAYFREVLLAEQRLQACWTAELY
jgi:hypothetical protein